MSPSRARFRFVLLSGIAACIGSKSILAQCAAPCVDIVERVAQNLAQPDPEGRAGDLWGGHQSRIVRTANGEVFAAFTVAGVSALSTEWRVARRTSKGWVIVGSGAGGREPAHLLRSSDDGLWLVSWPAGLPMLWTGTIEGEEVRWTSIQAPGPWVKSDWPYGSAGVSPNGRLCLLQSVERRGKDPPSTIVACLDTHQRWTSAKYPLDYRYCYSFVFPQNSGVTWVASRDERWDQLGFRAQPPQSPWVFNAVKTFRIDSVGAPLHTTLVHEEPPSVNAGPVLALARDAYQDDRGRLHIVYEGRGQRTRSGGYEIRYAVIERDTLKADGPLISSVNGWTDGFSRVLADRTGELFWFYNRDLTLLVYNLHPDSAPLVDRRSSLDFRGKSVGYPGVFVTASRGGNLSTDAIDALFGVANDLYYAHIRLR